MIASLVSFVIRLLLTVFTVVLVLSLMAVALVTMLGLIVWSLLRGRKPTIDVSGFAKARSRFKPRGAPARDAGEVVDVEVREVPDVGSATPTRLER